MQVIYILDDKAAITDWIYNRDEKVFTFPFVYKNESEIDIRQYIQKCSEYFWAEWVSKLKNIILDFYHISEHESPIPQLTIPDEMYQSLCPLPPTTAPSSYAPTGRPALGMMVSAAEARASTLDCTVCVGRVGAAANSKNI